MFSSDTTDVPGALAYCSDLEVHHEWGLCALHRCSFMATQGDEETFPPPVTEVASVGTNKLQDKEFISRSYADHQFGHDALKLKCRRTMNQSNKTKLAREGSRNYPYF